MKVTTLAISTMMATLASPGNIQAMLNHIHRLSEGEEKEGKRLANELREETSHTSTLTLKDSQEHRHLDPTWSMNRLGTEDASSIMQERLTMVITQYRTRGWNMPETIMLKQMSTQALEELKKLGATTPTVVNNGVDTLHTSCDHEDLSDAESRQYLAHEMAHIAIGKHPWLNPHRYMEVYTSPVGYMVIAPSLSYVGLVCLLGRKWKPGIIISSMGAAYALTARRCGQTGRDSLRSLCESPGAETLGIEYSCLSKLEEIECDILAALAMPEGGKQGAALWQKKLDTYGDGNGSQGDHPYYSTRVKYHKAIQWIQEKTAKDHS